MIRSRAKLAYDTVRRPTCRRDSPRFAERIAAPRSGAGRRGSIRPSRKSRRRRWRLPLAFRPEADIRGANAALSLAANMAIADALLAHKTGLFRVMAEPDDARSRRLRHTAKAFGLDWPADVDLAHFERTLDPAEPKQAAFMLAIRRAGQGASYVPFRRA